MTLQEKYGAEFFFDRLTIPAREGHQIRGHQVGVCIPPKSDKAATLADGWQVVRELAQWLIEKFDALPDDERFQIIVAWSRSAREHQGHIFKVGGSKDQIRQIAGIASYREFAVATGDRWTPMPGWEKDLFPDEPA